jgi:hypothetical protein
MNDQWAVYRLGDVTINWVEGDGGWRHNNYVFNFPPNATTNKMRDRTRSKINTKQTTISREKWMGFAKFVRLN